MKHANTFTTRCFILLSIYLLSFAFTSEAKAQVKGADLSWVTQMEASGYKWKDANGNYGDIFAICKGLGFNAVRLRVFVNPSNGWCNQADVVAKARRAAAQGMGVYLTLHFSDTWADPGHQTPPAAWANHNISQLYTDVYNHAKTVVTAVRAVANVGWVSIGNETNNGLLWPLGQASTNPSNYAGLIRSGYNGAKAAGAPYVGVHVSNMADYAVYTWNFGILYNNGVSWDFCAASLYPTTSNYATLISQAKTTAAAMKSKYGKNCVIAEFGIAYNSGSTGAAALKSARTICNDLFYWEPECYNWQGYGMGAWDPSTQKPTVILTSGLKSADVDLSEAENDINVYPNPLTSETLKVELGGLSGTTTIRILNVSGKEVKSLVVVDQPSVNIPQSGLKPGAYFVQIDNPQQKVVKTLIVK